MLSLMIVTDSGTAIAVRAAHLANAPSSIFVTELGMVMEVNLSQLLKA